MTVFINIILFAVLLWMSYYIVRFAMLVWRNKKRVAAFGFCLIAAALVALPAFIIL